MKYEKDLEYLRRELKNAQNIYDEAEENERESDAEMWMNRVTHLEFQIDVFKNAAKADEHKAKAKAWDKLMFEIDEINDEVAGKGLPSKITMAAKITALSNVMKEYESGESDEI